MILQIFEATKEYLAIIITAVITYFIGRRKTEAETMQAEGNALSVIQSVYDKFTNDTKAKLEEFGDIVLTLTTKVADLTSQVALLQAELDDCTKSRK